MLNLSRITVFYWFNLAIDPALKADISNQVKNRRTFAIISHPDAGKTTLTEKLLLYSGMIRTAGMVSGRKGGQRAASDWMSMEQERGISITASAMQFTFRDTVINVLDTPGHQDFSEDTYRTLTAADSVIMVLDAAKGVEAQTLKLFDACRLRKIPVITFINKLDLPPKEILDLMSEVEEVLGIQASALNYPAGLGKEFSGVLDLRKNELNIYKRTGAGGSSIPETEVVPFENLEGHHSLSEHAFAELRDSVDLIKEAGNPFELEDFLKGEVTPVFFGSAMSNFGVEPLFNALIELAPSPSPRKADQEDGEIVITPSEEPFSAYVFKLQANMNPKHRDCVAFMRINSGRYEKDQMVKNQTTGKKIRLSRPHSLQISERNTLESAYPGDIIGVINPGHFSIGDTIVASNRSYKYKALPQFQPEIFASIRPKDLGKRKAIDKGLTQLASEGAVQMLYDYEDLGTSPIIGAVGWLQFEVMQYRLEDEYGVKTILTKMPYTCSAWIMGDIGAFKKPSQSKLMKDRFDRPMLLCNDVWEKNYAIKENPDHELKDYA